MNLLTPKELSALKIAFAAYRFKRKIESKVIAGIFKAVTGKELTHQYFTVPIIKEILENTF